MISPSARHPRAQSRVHGGKRRAQLGRGEKSFPRLTVRCDSVLARYSEPGGKGGRDEGGGSEARLHRGLDHSKTAGSRHESSQGRSQEGEMFATRMCTQALTDFWSFDEKLRYFGFLF